MTITPTIAQSAEALCQVRANASELDVNLFLCAIERHYGTEHMRAAHKLAGEIAQAKHDAERAAVKTFAVYPEASKPTIHVRTGDAFETFEYRTKQQASKKIMALINAGYKIDTTHETMVGGE